MENGRATLAPWKHDFDVTGWVILAEGRLHVARIEYDHRRILRPREAEADARLIAAAPDLLDALIMQTNWKMRDGTPCACPLGKNEDEPKRKMPTLHATSCESLRAAIARATGEKLPTPDGEEKRAKIAAELSYEELADAVYGV